MTRVDEPRRDREVLVAMALSGPQCGGVVGHGAASSFPETDIKRNVGSIATLASETVVIPEFPPGIPKDSRVREDL
jgi:hypothetical protein